ncbi:MAG: hypothetical protein PHV34_01445 [Verrucomicrobiae bacterium]|nr:hypothetical protein [Verrucomicrobiae bacterium]
MRKSLIVLFICNLAILARGSGEAAPCVWVEDTLVKVCLDADPTGGEKPVIRVQCAKNEHEPVQVHVRSKIPLENLALKTSGIVHESGRYVG